MTKKEEALLKIRELLTDGAIGTDGTLFSENELARKLNISRSPIRDALAVLSKEGLIEQIPQVGIRKRKFTDGDLREIYDVRSFLETYATAQAAIALSEDSKQLLRSYVQEMEEAADRCDIKRFLDSDIKFHVQIAKDAGLVFVEDLLKQIGSKVKIIGYLSTPDTESMKIVVEEHQKILDSLTERNPISAKAAAQEHIDETKKRLEKARGRAIFDF